MDYNEVKYFLLSISILCLLILTIKHFVKKSQLKYQSKIWSRTIIISKLQPTVEGEGVEFISTKKDGTAIIKTLFSSEILEAKEKEFFVGKDYGLHGLHLISSSYEDQEIVLERFTPEIIEEE